MKVKHVIAMLKDYNPELNFELTQLIFSDVPREDTKTVNELDPVIMRLDFPIIGFTEKEGDLLMVCEAAPQMLAFGKDIKRLDGEPITDDYINEMKSRLGVVKS